MKLPAPDGDGLADIVDNTHADAINRLGAAGMVIGTTPTEISMQLSIR
ncbi:MAG: hypothetical protein M3O70_00645 [Actinomycetota bacterium]|nr:hypothetical protein [Actinomycetota bacterium]